MTLPASGAISLNNVNVELGLTATAQIGLNDAAVRDLFGVASGVITMADGYGKLHGMVATGGTITTDGDYKVHTFNSSGTFTVTTLGDIGTVEYLVIAGGGGSGAVAGGGGGCGGGGASAGGGGTTTASGGNGGNGTASSITGSSITRGGGGGDDASGANGGSGVVIIRYQFQAA